MRKILVVDDSRTVRQQVAMTLLAAGFEVLEAQTGREALQQIEAVPDLAMAICDVNMPEMTGIEMLESLHAKGKTATLPVVMLTTEGAVGLLEKAKRAGAKGWIVKPFKDHQLIAVVRKVVGV